MGSGACPGRNAMLLHRFAEPGRTSGSLRNDPGSAKQHSAPHRARDKLLYAIRPAQRDASKGYVNSRNWQRLSPKCVSIDASRPP